MYYWSACFEREKHANQKAWYENQNDAVGQYLKTTDKK